MQKCGVQVESSGYNAKYNGAEVVQTELDGGAPRQRLDKVGAWGTVSVQWTVGPSDYDYLCAFYRAYKAAPFTIDLILDSSQPREYTAIFVQDSFALYSQRGFSYVVQATLRVEPLPADPDGDVQLLGRFNQ